MFAARREVLEREGATIRTRLMPRVSAFGEYAYGRPGFEQFTRDPHTYWLAGVRVRWVPWDWGAVARTAEAVGLQQRILVADEQAFSERLTRQVQAPLQAMDRLEAALETDRRIIALHEQVERQASARFDERDITAAAYVDARTDLQEARIALVRHRAELARAQAEYLTILGMELR